MSHWAEKAGSPAPERRLETATFSLAIVEMREFAEGADVQIVTELP